MIHVSRSRGHTVARGLTSHRMVRTAPVVVGLVAAGLVGAPSSPAAAATSYPATPTVSSVQYPEGTWSGAPGTAGTFTFQPTAADIVGFSYRMDDAWTSQSAPVVRGASAKVTITPADPGVHTLYVKDHASGGTWTAETAYSFGVGTGNTDFGLMAAGISINQDIGTADLRAKAVQTCVSGAVIDTAVDGKTAPSGTVRASAFNSAAVETLTPGTDADASVAADDDTEYDLAWQQTTGGPPPADPVSDTKPGTITASVTSPALTCADDTSGDFEATGGGSYEIKSTWREVDHALAVTRWGYFVPPNGGFGNAKVEQKHNLTDKVVHFVTKHPFVQYHISGLKWNYISWDVHHIKCSGWGPWRKCRSVEKTSVLVSHDFRGLSDGKPFGTVTAYCQTYEGKCPSWVKNALNVTG